MKAITIWVVKASYYVDEEIRDNWTVNAYTDKDQAMLHCQRAQTYLDEYKNWQQNNPDEDQENEDVENPYDNYIPLCHAPDCTTYEVEETKLFVHFDQYQESVGL